MTSDIRLYGHLRAGTVIIQSQLLPGVLQGSCHYLCNGICLSRPGIEPQSPACRSNALLTELQRRSGFLVNENTEKAVVLRKFKEEKQASKKKLDLESETVPANKKPKTVQIQKQKMRIVQMVKFQLRSHRT